MQARLFLGPAGSGKTFRCLTEIRAALGAEPDGPPLLLIAPKQTTYQLERQLLADPAGAQSGTRTALPLLRESEERAGERRQLKFPLSLALSPLHSSQGEGTRGPSGVARVSSSTGPALPGYSRLYILSFERLADFIFRRLRQAPPQLLNEEGRLMVLRGLLAAKRDQLRLFRASARLTGFARHLNLALRELQRHQQTPESLRELAEHAPAGTGLGPKLTDLATLLGDYLAWLTARGLHDAGCLLDFAAQALREPHPPSSRMRDYGATSPPPPGGYGATSPPPPGGYGATSPPLPIAGIWVDGFTEFSPQELDLLAELIPLAPRAVITFCLDQIPKAEISWLAHWSVVRHSFQLCQRRLAELPDCEIATEVLPRRREHSRFRDNPVLRHLEAHFAEPQPLKSGPLASAIRLAQCVNPEAEATLAAREILRFVRAGGRYGEISVQVRDLADYHAQFADIFARYEIPFFLDRRESVAHHPLAELTRSALRTVTFVWPREDWFTALKTGLVPGDEADFDRLENEALARGWSGAVWQQPIAIPDDPELAQSLEQLRRRIMPPFTALRRQLLGSTDKPSGPQLAAAIHDFWDALKVEETLRRWTEEEGQPRPIHLTVLEQLTDWLENLARAFPTETLSMREWLPILEAGLASLTVGVIPPVLDQVLVGAIDRSRNPESRLAFVLGLNEGVFPALPEPSALLSDSDRAELEKQGVALGGARQQLARERFLFYLACTRARERLVLTCCQSDASGRALNTSPFLRRIQQLFPTLELEVIPRTADWPASEHISELVPPILRSQSADAAPHASELDTLADLPAIVELRRRLAHLTGATGRMHQTPSPPQSGGEGRGEEGISPLPNPLPAPCVAGRGNQRSVSGGAGIEMHPHLTPAPAGAALSPALADRLYGPELRTSVSRMEQFAACPFKFFVHSGLRAEERKLFELDARNQGSFQHDVLAEFHNRLQKENRRWRDLEPATAGQLVRQIAASLMLTFRDGLLQSSEASRFTARILTDSLVEFVETLVGWMRGQYAFDPAAVELPFGEGAESFPPWTLVIDPNHRLLLSGRIDRIDLCPQGNDSALCVVVDYKSSEKQLDDTLLHYGLQLQLPAYLNVLRHWPDPRPVFGVARLTPAGMFYVNLRGHYERAQTRDESLADLASTRNEAYQHKGRFDASHLRQLDQRPDATAGDQFNYRVKKDGTLYRNSRDPLTSAEFHDLLDHVERLLTEMGRDIYAGVAKVDPYRKGAETACDQCDYRSICRIDLWTHTWRVLQKPPRDEER